MILATHFIINRLRQLQTHSEKRCVPDLALRFWPTFTTILQLNAPIVRANQTKKLNTSPLLWTRPNIHVFNNLASSQTILHATLPLQLPAVYAPDSCNSEWQPKCAAMGSRSVDQRIKVYVSIVLVYTSPVQLELDRN